MLGKYEAKNIVDGDGNPTGGHVEGIGMDIDWQDGPLGRGDDRKAANGAFVETVIDAARQRIQFYQDNGFSCEENRGAIEHLKGALELLNTRTKRREQQNTEGTHKGY